MIEKGSLVRIDWGMIYRDSLFGAENSRITEKLGPVGKMMGAVKSIHIGQYRVYAIEFDYVDLSGFMHSCEGRTRPRSGLWISPRAVSPCFDIGEDL